MCQCPVSGYPHFYASLERPLNEIEKSVNALSRAIPISTANDKDCIQEYKYVSMPCLGLSPFLHENNRYQGNHQLCQCPVSGYPHFYISWMMTDCNKQKMCQCPVSGYPHFYWAERNHYDKRGDVSMPCLGLSPFLQEADLTLETEFKDVSMPCLGLSPFLRSPLGTRINRGHNLETIHVIVRQFSFAPIFTPFFPSLGIPALFHLKWFVFRHFYYTCFFIPAQGIFAFSACFSISVSWPLIFPFP